MLCFENIALHNVAQLTPLAGGQRLQRVPDAVRASLNPMAQERMLEPAGVELRFVSRGPVTLTLSCPGAADANTPCVAEVFHGPFQDWRGRGERVLRQIGPGPTPIRILPAGRPLHLPAGVRETLAFAPQVTRLLLPPVSEPVVLHGAEAEANDLRPPRPEELPRRTMLSYGTSITHGAGASGPHLTYVHQCAARLGVDALNLGTGGSCHCEPELADWIADRRDWSFATLALSVNMGGFSDADFEQRVEYFVNTVAGADHARPVFCITLWTYFADHGITEDPATTPDPGLIAFAANRRRILRDVVERSPHPNVRVFEGPDLLRDFAGLSQDLIHPGDFAMTEMGWRLADAIRPHLPATPQGTANA